VGSSCISSAFGSDGCGITRVVDGFLVDLQDMSADVVESLPSAHDLLLLSGVVVANFIGQVLLNAGFQRMDAGRGSAVNTSQVLFGCVWDVSLLHTAPSIAMLLGTGAIAAGVYGTTMSKASEGQQHQEQQGRLVSSSSRH
jgi:drug/metabolite transporter (DMT)-like permease